MDKMERKAQPSIKSDLTVKLLLGREEADMSYKLQSRSVP